ncbi:MAG: phosphoglycerate dehydrogenase [Mariprofundaceae bacterium]
MPKVWIADKMSERAVNVLRERGLEVDYKPGLSVEEQVAIAGDYDGIAVRSATRLKGEVLSAAKRVKVIGRAGIGVDNIDVPACSRRGIVVMNTPSGNAITTAELAVSHLMAAARRIPQAHASTAAGKWEKNRFMGVELTGKKVGVIGAGNIGAIVCDRLKGLRMNVLVFDPFISNDRADAMGVTKVETVAELASQVDMLTIHVPLLESTRNLINAEVLASMKKGAILVNCARGGIVDEEALYEACKTGHIYAALDVYETEPAREHPLFELDNVICTPHIGASTAEAQENVAVQIAEQIADYLLLGAVTNAINVPSVSEEEYRVLLPYLQLGLRLGQLLGQVMQPGYSRVTVHLEGQVSTLNCKPVVNAALQGLLSQSMEDINAVNAGVIAHERGIDISEVLREQSDHFTTLLRIEVEGDEGRRSVAGTVFDGKRPRLVQIDDCEVEIAPVGRILFIENRDRPGVVAGVGGILADKQVNIADFRLGRRLDEQTAITLVTVDSRPDDETIEALAALENLITVRYVELDTL